MNHNDFLYYVVNKPFGILSQFRDRQGRKTLSDCFEIPNDVYPVGRLDLDSEGLLILTNDRKLTDFLLNPVYKHEREYYAQVEGIPLEEELKKLEAGVIIEKKLTLPAKVKMVDSFKVWERTPPVRERKNIPTTWVSLTLHEGRNRQVRKMTASIGHPTLRLIRVRIEKIFLGDMQPGEIRQLTEEEVSGFNINI